MEEDHLAAKLDVAGSERGGGRRGRQLLKKTSGADLNVEEWTQVVS